MRRLLSPVLCTLALLLCWQGDALRAFCGFYVAKADTSLFNRRRRSCSRATATAPC